MRKHILNGELIHSTLTNKSFNVVTEFQIFSIDDLTIDEFDKNKSELLNCDGYKVEGLVFFDIYKSSRNFSDLPIKEHTKYNLRLMRGNSSTILPVIILKKEHEIEISDNTFRFFYSFCNIGKVTKDDIYIFESKYDFINYPRIFSFLITRSDNQTKSGFINSINVQSCLQILLNKFKNQKFISDDKDLLDIKIEELIFNKENLHIFE